MRHDGSSKQGNSYLILPHLLLFCNALWSLLVRVRSGAKEWTTCTMVERPGYGRAEQMAAASLQTRFGLIARTNKRSGWCNLACYVPPVFFPLLVLFAKFRYNVRHACAVLTAHLA